MKYSVIIPPAKAKRNKNKKLIIEKIDGNGFVDKKTFSLESDKHIFEFNIIDDFEYIYDTKIIDGNVFNVYVEYSNESGSRAEIKYLVPSKL